MVKKFENIKGLKAKLRYLFSLHCPDCGGELRSDDYCDGKTVYVCTNCHTRWI